MNPLIYPFNQRRPFSLDSYGISSPNGALSLCCRRVQSVPLQDKGAETMSLDKGLAPFSRQCLD